MKGLLLIPAAVAVMTLTGCTGGLREDLGILDGHHRELKHRIDKVEAHERANTAAVKAMDARVAAAQAAADAAAHKAEVALRIAKKALANTTKK